MKHPLRTRFRLQVQHLRLTFLGPGKAEAGEMDRITQAVTPETKLAEVDPLIEPFLQALLETVERRKETEDEDVWVPVHNWRDELEDCNVLTGRVGWGVFQALCFRGPADVAVLDLDRYEAVGRGPGDPRVKGTP